jgi:Flp pilus assembly protein TadG
MAWPLRRQARTRRQSRRLGRRSCRGDDGAAVVEFVLVGSLLLFVALGVIQVGLLLHARNVLAADAAEGARRAASLGVDPTAGASTAEQLARRSVPGIGRDLSCSSRQSAGPGGLAIAEVTCSAELKMTFVPVGSVHISVTGRSLKETAQ